MTTKTHPASLTTAQRDQARRALIATSDITGEIRGNGDAFELFHYTNAAGAPCAVAFRGKAIKPAFRFSFRSAELRASHCNEWVQAQEAARARQDARRTERNAPHSLAVGDVLMSMWGYEQTNIDYYQVIELHGRTQVTLQEIAKRREETGFLQGDCVPQPAHLIDEPRRCRVDGAHNSVRLSSFERASKIEPLAAVDGVRMWPIDHWTAYA